MADPRTFTVLVTQRVAVTLDAEKFTESFREEFRESFYQFHDLEDHAMHLAQLKARGVMDLSKYRPDEFVEGYGEIGPMGISATVLSGGHEEIEQAEEGHA